MVSESPINSQRRCANDAKRQDDNLLTRRSDLLKSIVNFLTRSDYKKSPKITFDKFSISLGTSGKWVGYVFINKPGGYGSGYYCYIKPDFVLSGDLPEWLEKELCLLAENPVEYVSAYGKRTGRCCFCSLELTDPRSVSVGYGEVCSRRWFLPWGLSLKKGDSLQSKNSGSVAELPNKAIPFFPQQLPGGRIESSPEPIKEKQKNKEHWDYLKEVYGEVIHVDEEDEMFTHRIGSIAFFNYGTSIKEIVEECQAYWLLDAIASYQMSARSHPQMREFQIWELKVELATHEAMLVGSWDINKSLYRQRIDNTSFPKSYVKFYLEKGILTCVGIE